MIEILCYCFYDLHFPSLIYDFNAYKLLYLIVIAALMNFCCIFLLYIGEHNGHQRLHKFVIEDEFNGIEVRGTI